MVAVVGVTPTGATSPPASAFTSDDLPALNSPITATSSGRPNASVARAIGTASETSAGSRSASASAHASMPTTSPAGSGGGARRRTTNRRTDRDAGGPGAQPG